MLLCGLFFWNGLKGRVGDWQHAMPTFHIIPFNFSFLSFGIGCDWLQRQKIVDTDRDLWEAGGKTHTAFVFIKPHAVYEKALADG